MVAGGSKAWSASSTRKARLSLGLTALPGSVLDPDKGRRTMKFGKMTSVPVLLATFLLLAGPVRAEDEAKKEPSEPSKTADSTSSAQSNPSCTPQSNSVSVLSVSLFDGSVR